MPFRPNTVNDHTVQFTCRTKLEGTGARRLRDQCFLGRPSVSTGKLDPDPTAVMADALTTSNNMMAGWGKGKLLRGRCVPRETPTSGPWRKKDSCPTCQYGNPPATSATRQHPWGLAHQRAVQVWEPSFCSATWRCRPAVVEPGQIPPQGVLGRHSRRGRDSCLCGTKSASRLPRLSPPLFSACSFAVLGGHIPKSTSTGRSPALLPGRAGCERLLNLGVSLGSVGDVAPWSINAGSLRQLHVRPAPALVPRRPNFPTRAAAPTGVQKNTFAEDPGRQGPSGF